MTGAKRALKRLRLKTADLVGLYAETPYNDAPSRQVHRREARLLAAAQASADKREALKHRRNAR